MPPDPPLDDSQRRVTDLPGEPLVGPLAFEPVKKRLESANALLAESSPATLMLEAAQGGACKAAAPLSPARQLDKHAMASRPVIPGLP